MAGLTPELPLFKNTANSYKLIEDYKSLVKQNFRNLMFTIPGERMMDLDFGVGLRKFLFEIDNPRVYGQISTRIRKQVNKYLPYVEISDISFNSNAINEEAPSNFLGISIKYVITPLEAVDNISLSLPED